MTDDVAEAPRGQRSEKTWRDQIPAMFATAVFSIIVAATVAFGGRVVSTGETSAVLVSRIDHIVEQNKTQDTLLRELLVKQGNVYTREEARGDREAAERRFQSMENRLGDLGRRIEALETNNRLIQQFIFEKGPQVRR